MPTIKEVLAKVIDYYTNPQNYITEWYRNGRQVVGYPVPIDDVLDIECLGSGHFSTVFALGEHSVLKITSSNNDDAYDEFARYCLRHPNNPWLPKIYRRLVLQGDVRAYVLERLTLRDDDDYETPAPISLAYMYHKLKNEGSEYVKSLELKCPHLNELFNDLGDALNDATGENIMLRGDQLVLSDPMSVSVGRY